MGLLSRLFNQDRNRSSTGGLPCDWKSTLRRSNFFMARREIAGMFRIANQSAEAEGRQTIWKKEVADGWQEFARNPCYETAVRFVEITPTIFDYFLGCCPAGALHRPVLRKAATFSLGKYCLKNNRDNFTGLTEINDLQSAFFPRQFRGEVIYNTDPISFLGRQWTFMISSVGKRIYKWAASLDVGTSEDFGQIGYEVFAYCEQWLSTPTQEKQGFCYWDTSDGNVILQLTQSPQLGDISIFVTSRKIRNLEKLIG